MVLTTVVPQLQSIEGRHSFRAAEADLHGPDYSGDHRDSAVAVRFGGRCPCCAGREDSQVPPWRRHSFSHSCSSLRKTSRSQCLPFCCRQAQMFVIMAGMDQNDSYAIFMKIEEGFHRIFMSWWAHIAFHAQECVLFPWAPTGGGHSAENCGFSAVSAHQQGHQHPLSWCRGRFSWSFG